MKNLLLALLVWLTGSGTAGRAAEPDAQLLTVGIVPQFAARKLYETWRPILDALEKETGLRFTLKGADTITAFEQQLAVGQFDLAYVNPYFVGVRNHQGYLPLARDIGSSLAGVVVVRKDSPIQSVRELAGQTVAFPAANSLVGCLLIRAELENDHGVRVQPMYTRTHDSSFLNVAVGTTVAAGGAKSTLERQSAEMREQLRVIHTTRDLAPLPFVAHPRVPEDIRQRVQAALLKLGTTPAGKELLSKVPIKQIGPATLTDYEPLRRLGLERYEN